MEKEVQIQNSDHSKKSKPRLRNISKNLAFSRMAGQDLSNQDFIDCDMSLSDFTGANLSLCSLYGSDMTGSRLNGAIISLNCLTFHGLKLDNQQVDYLLYLILLADIPVEIRRKIEEVLTVAKKLKLDKVFKQA